MFRTWLAARVYERRAPVPTEVVMTRKRNGLQLASDRTASSKEVAWTFLTNHAHVLLLLANHPEMRLREVALEVGITERAVQRIVVDLENEKYLKHEKIGRRNHYSVNRKLKLRHPIEAHQSIGALIDLVGLDGVDN